MRTRSPIFARAVEQYHACRREYGLYLEAAFTRASDETAGALLNDRGRRHGVDAFTLFSGPEVRALAYASEELVEHWKRYPRMTYQSFEAEWADPGYLEDAAAADEVSETSNDEPF